MEGKLCWCGNELKESYSQDYYLCNNCNTLVAKTMLHDNEYNILEDENGFYSKDYWVEHVKDDYGYPDIFERSRKDIYDRCLYWLKNIMKYKLPQAKILELGCGHGGLVYLMNLMGYQALGAELSPWVCEFSNRVFGNTMLKGRIEDLHIKDNEFDMIILMDVFEHLNKPLDTLKVIKSKLKDDGILVLQMPCFREFDKSYNELIDDKSIFVEQLKANEHLYLYTMQGIKDILKVSGFNYIAFEKEYYPYDMFIFASQNELKKYDEESVLDYLESEKSARVILALNDIYDENQLNKQKIQEIEKDREARLEVINRQQEMILEREKHIDEIEKDREARLEVINRQQEIILEREKHIDKIEIDKKARQEDVSSQQEIILEREKHINEIEKDREARLEVINRQQEMILEREKQIDEIEKDREARLEVINRQQEKILDLEKQIKDVKTDRNTKQETITDQQKLLHDKENSINELALELKKSELVQTKQNNIINDLANELKHINDKKIIKMLRRIKLI
ncbi:methyltransferase domain-containing protein [Vallitalea okinawensis]|uniref:methyltransferase domain-containing protein n=1 Tax=Vallitalea okinawensis TaxID=2078660 RepID=UPI000CFD0A63|nr:methyltransferase domain-containing protein [Vallitalea okinawensis]